MLNYLYRARWALVITAIGFACLFIGFTSTHYHSGQSVSKEDAFISLGLFWVSMICFYLFWVSDVYRGGAKVA